MRFFRKFLPVFLVLTSGFIFAQAPPQPYGALPSKRQLAWHQVDVYGLVHFTPTTFENKEWGYGDADPKIFNPKEFDADKIVAALKAGGLKGLVLVAKHHDGFELALKLHGGAQQQEHGGEPDEGEEDPQEGGVDRTKGRRGNAHEQKTRAPDGCQRQHTENIDRAHGGSPSLIGTRVLPSALTMATAIRACNFLLRSQSASPGR